jgi:signal peptidase
MMIKKVILIGIITGLALVIYHLDLSFLTVTGTSMNPEITQDDILIVIPAQTLKVGDVITYSHEIDEKSYLFTHRIIEMDGNIIKTKGDSLSAPDTYIVSQNDVKGKLAGKIPYVGALPHFARTASGYIFFILMPALLLVIMEIKKLMRQEQ